MYGGRHGASAIDERAKKNSGSELHFESSSVDEKKKVRREDIEP